MGVIAPEHLAPDLRDTMDWAVDRCRKALADYRAGVLDEGELRDALFRAGFVEHGREAWMLDLQAARWWRYDGVAVDAVSSPHMEIGFARLRAVIDELAGDPAWEGTSS